MTRTRTATLALAATGSALAVALSPASATAAGARAATPEQRLADLLEEAELADAVDACFGARADG